MASWCETVGPFPVRIRNVKGSRRIRIRVEGKSVVVTKPRWVSKKAAVQFVVDCDAWITREIEKVAGRPLDRLHYRGVEHEILHAGVPPVRLANGQFWAPGETQEERLENVIEWMKRRARPVLREAVVRWSLTMGVEPQRVGVRDQTSRWGSCSSTGGVSFNWRLVMAPPDVLEYIVVHELAHLTEHNHSQRFWSIVEAHCPNYRDHERWLDEHNDALIQLGR